MSEHSVDLLNIYELQEPGGSRHIVAFLEPAIAAAWGFLSRAVVGEFTPRPDGEFDPASFRLNPEFVAAVVEYMNEVAIRSPELLSQARQNPSSRLGLVDTRNLDVGTDPPLTDLLGHFKIDDLGQPEPGSFEYNPGHAMFDPRRGPSGLLTDRKFYNWLHPLEETRRGS